jgi:hypothetical protein
MSEWAGVFGTAKPILSSGGKWGLSSSGTENLGKDHH